MAVSPQPRSDADGAIPEDLIARAHSSQMLRAGLDSRQAALVVAAGYGFPLEDVARVVDSPLGARDVARPGGW